jgi:hypothetical protein
MRNAAGTPAQRGYAGDVSPVPVRVIVATAESAMGTLARAIGVNRRQYFDGPERGVGRIDGRIVTRNAES